MHPAAPHGPHNAPGMDALRAEGICVAAARWFGGIVAPTFYWHVHETGSAGEKIRDRAADEFIARAEQLLDAYEGPRDKPLTFADVETIWVDEIRPKLKDFASMQEDPLPPADSPWHANCRVPPTQHL